jgi:tetratricopeptide (TPR) repeat protein
MRMNRLTPLLLVSGCLTLSCAHRTMGLSTLGTPCSTAGPRLTQAWRGLNDALETPGGCEKDNGLHCQALRAQIERLSVDCPNNPDVLMANALLAFEARNLVRAQQLLDELTMLRVTYPEAAVLRARIALEQGNLQFALRFLDQQIRQTGDYAGLRETYASALFLAGRMDEARAQLLAAKQLGAPAWRIAYGQGLIDESVGKFEFAKQCYQEALQDKPGWRQAESRLRALQASGKVAR